MLNRFELKANSFDRDSDNTGHSLIVHYLGEKMAALFSDRGELENINQNGGL